MRAAVVSPRQFASWDERGAVLSHFVGALACFADVDVLACGAARSTEPEGAAQRITFPERPSDSARLRALEQLALGPSSSPSGDCDCLSRARAQLVYEVPLEVEQELLSLAGGDAPELVDHLLSQNYDLVVFTAPDTASTVVGVRAVAERSCTVLLPLVPLGPRLSLGTIREVFASVDHVAAVSRYEASIARRAGATQVTVLGSVARVHPLALRDEPVLFEDRAVVMARDWAEEPPSDALLLLVRRLNLDLMGTAVVRLIGPGWEGVPDDVGAPHAESRLDVGRWVARSLALWDPDPRRLLGREVVESLLYGTPVVTSSYGAAREHAEAGDGGLWYRSYDELRACIALLAKDADTRKTLGAQGRAYAEGGFADADAFIERISRFVAGVLDGSRWD